MGWVFGTMVLLGAGVWGGLLVGAALSLWCYKALHDEVGARKSMVVGVDLISCNPISISTHNTSGSCAQEMNNVALMFNANLS
ncbi:hypothetical protein VNO78_09280 [Psophocarpus tetragonolobus]|uniref:Uncharacterized protein n=1 Tax=Psophocarpus tetragonolobus TaxID=3891 RepID=A0AAN9XTH3_PSOTE